MPTETDYQTKILDGYKASGGYGFKLANRFKKGVVDLWVGYDGVPMFIEVKKIGKPTKDVVFAFMLNYESLFTSDMVPSHAAVAMPKDAHPTIMQRRFSSEVNPFTRAVGVAVVTLPKGLIATAVFDPINPARMQKLWLVKNNQQKAMWEALPNVLLQFIINNPVLP